MDNKDSLAKMVYSRMFDWLVDKINTAIGQDAEALALVGVLDIYGEPNGVALHCTDPSYSPLSVACSSHEGSWLSLHPKTLHTTNLTVDCCKAEMRMMKIAR